MFTIVEDNVNINYFMGMQLLLDHGFSSESDKGKVIVAPTPVVNTYLSPRKRVLFDTKRDANPFFHLVESLWMVAGLRDARVLDRYISDFSSRFAEDNGKAHGAYGYRWRDHFKSVRYEQPIGPMGTPPDVITTPIDQMLEAGRLLRQNPESRQVVIAMWDPSADLGASKRDIPCNDLIMFRTHAPTSTEPRYTLDMSIVARSHDSVWGAYGANVVHMSVLHEVVAGLADMEMGSYHHFSNNFHVYESILLRLGSFEGNPDIIPDPYLDLVVMPICTNPEEASAFVRDCERLFREIDNTPYIYADFETTFMNVVVAPMMSAHSAFKMKQYDDARTFINFVLAEDWKLAGQNWLMKRLAKAEGTSL